MDGADYGKGRKKPQHTMLNLKPNKKQNMNTIRFNTAKNGIEISFPGKPSEEIRTSLKANGFRWGKFNKVWYITDTERNRDKAAKFGTLPAGPELHEDDLFDNMVIDQAAQSIGLLA